MVLSEIVCRCSPPARGRHGPPHIARLEELEAAWLQRPDRSVPRPLLFAADLLDRRWHSRAMDCGQNDINAWRCTAEPLRREQTCRRDDVQKLHGIAMTIYDYRFMMGWISVLTTPLRNHSYIFSPTPLFGSTKTRIQTCTRRVAGRSKLGRPCALAALDRRSLRVVRIASA